MAAVEDELTSFKLFGTVIQKGDGESREREETGQQTSDNLAAEEAAARVAAALPCPRCKSTETKFCYFNNYNVNQPRHFCKACHRYWTAGGTLRNVPHRVGRRRGRPAQRGGATSGAAANCAVDYPSPARSGGPAAERWLIAQEMPGRVDWGDEDSRSARLR